MKGWAGGGPVGLKLGGLALGAPLDDEALVAGCLFDAIVLCTAPVDPDEEGGDVEVSANVVDVVGGLLVTLAAIEAAVVNGALAVW